MYRHIASIILLFISFAALSKPTLHWYTDDPEDLRFYQTSEPYSIGMDTVNLLLRTIDTFDIQFSLASVARIDKQLLQTANTCTANRIKTQARLRNNLFSLPLNIHRLPQLFFTPGSLTIPQHSLNAEGAIANLSAVLQANPGKFIAVLEGISYGERIDAMLAEVDPASINRFSLDNRYSATAKLLDSGMVDMSIEYPSHLQHMRTKLGLTRPLNYLSFALPEQYITSHVACSRSEFGEQVIAEVNQRLTELYGTDAHKQAHLRHMPEEIRPEFSVYYEQFFANVTAFEQ